MKNKILLALLSFACLASVSCNSEQDDLAKAQDCLDKVPQSNPTQADECLQYVEKHDSQQANILKCGIYMTSGGMIESKIVSAYQALKADTGSNKEATYMAVLSLDLPNITAAYSKAEQANTYCQRSGVPGLMFLANAIFIGTSMNKTIFDLTGSALNINNAAAEVASMLDKCTGVNPPTTTPPADCTAKLESMGQTATVVAATYCDSSSADKDVCAKFNGAVEAAGGDNSKAGQALLCYLKGLQYNPNPSSPTTACY